MIYDTNTRLYASRLNDQTRDQKLRDIVVRENLDSIALLIRFSRYLSSRQNISYEYQKRKQTVLDAFFAEGISHNDTMMFFRRVGIR